MTVTLTYVDADAYVAIDVDSLTGAEVISIERSIDQSHWTTVRGAACLEVSGAPVTGHKDYEFAPCVPNYYRVTLSPSGCGVTGVTGTQSADITPELSQVWIKSVTRPFLNRPVGGTCVAMGDLETEILASDDEVMRPTRAAAFPVINRTMPTGVTDLALGRVWTLLTRTYTLEAHRLMDYLYASGDILFIQVPCGDCAQTIEHGYVIAHDPSYRRHRRYRNRVVWTASVQEVAPPGPDIGYREATWATVLAQYGSWSAVIAANPTWADVLALLPDPSEVIVP